MSPTPSEDAVRRRAHEIWIARGRAHGNALDDWLAAEREIVGARASPPLPAPLAPSAPVVVPLVPPPTAAAASGVTKPAKPSRLGRGGGKGKR